LTIELSGPVSLTTTTGPFGEYSFRGLPAGTYFVCQSSANPGTQIVPFWSTYVCPSGLLGYTRTVAVGSTSTVLGFDFGNKPQ